MNSHSFLVFGMASKKLKLSECSHTTLIFLVEYRIYLWLITCFTIILSQKIFVLHVYIRSVKKKNDSNKAKIHYEKKKVCDTYACKRF